MIGRAISHYRVLGTLGSGGMGVVYLAEDERLGRQVALKFLPPDSVTNRQALERFRVEARAASSLSHPGICAIFDIGESEGTPYIVMEVLKGESLRDRINRGPMKVTDLVDIAIQLADALDAAHAQGIIHRDIKPSNIFVGDKNRTKILDFGLAKLTQSSAPHSSDGVKRALDASTHRELTMPGSALGTVSYMSPEQARGEDVDTRTDLFSLGVVLYEMATGMQAFGGSTQAIVFDAILNRAPQPIGQFNSAIPPRLEALIATALEKDRELRHQHASDFEAELKRIRRDIESSSLMASAMSRTVVLPPSERRSATTSAAPAEPPPRRSWIWMTAAAILLIALAAAGFKLWSDSSSQLAVNTPSTSTANAAPPPIASPPPTPTPTPAPAPVSPVSPPPVVPTRPIPEARSQPAQPAVTPAPQRSPGGSPSSAATAVPGPTPSPTAPTPPPAIEPQAPAPTQTTAPDAPQPQPTPAAEPPAAQPPPRSTAAAPPPTQPAIPPTSPVESDDALVRSVIRTYERAIETKNVDLFRSVRPGLSAAEEGRLRASFSQIDSQQVDIVIEDLRIDGRTATVRLSRRDTIMSGGRRQTANSRQTLRMEKGAAGWIITDILGQ